MKARKSPEEVKKMVARAEEINEHINRYHNMINDERRFFTLTRLGKAIVELKDIREDLRHKDMEDFSRELEEYARKLESIGDEESAEVLINLKRKGVVPNPEEVGKLKEIVAEIESEERGKHYEEFREKYTGYMKYLLLAKDRKTARKLWEIRKPIYNEEQKHLDEVKKYVDAIENTEAKVFASKLKIYIEYMEREKDKKIIDELHKAAIVKYILNYENAIGVMEELVYELTKPMGEEQKWTNFIKKFYKGGIELEIKELNGMGDKLSVRKLEYLKTNRIEKEGHDQIIKELQLWVQNMHKGEYIKKVEEGAKDEIDGIIMKRDQELSAQRGKAINSLLKILNHRIEELQDKDSKGVKEKAAKAIKKREDGLKTKWQESKRKFREISEPILQEVTRLEDGSTLAELSKEAREASEAYNKLKSEMKESIRKCEVLRGRIRFMVQNQRFSNSEITQVYHGIVEIENRKIELSEQAIEADKKFKEIEKMREEDYKGIMIMQDCYKKAKLKLEKMNSELGLNIHIVDSTVELIDEEEKKRAV